MISGGQLAICNFICPLISGAGAIDLLDVMKTTLDVRPRGADQDGPESGLRWLLGGAAKQSFLGSAWDQSPFHLSRENSAFYHPLASEADAREIASNALRLSLARVGRPLVELVRREQSFARDTAKSPAELWNGFDQGATVLVQMAQHFHPPLARLCSSLESELRGAVDATLICSPKGYRTGIHFDRHHAIVLQLSGSKRWTLFDRKCIGPLCDLPPLPFETPAGGLLRLGRQRAEETEQVGLSRALRLEAGDLLYVPAGVYHEVEAAEEASFHITLAVRQTTYLDLMIAALARHAEVDSQLRMAIPLPEQGKPSDDLKTTADRIAERFSSNLQAEAALADLDAALKAALQAG
jgi:ribosomal protein L16 Arg81 hydroxylase